MGPTTAPIGIFNISSTSIIWSGSSTYNICSNTIHTMTSMSCTTSYISSHTSLIKYTNPAAIRWVLPSLHGQGRLLQLSFRGPKEASVHCHGGPVHHQRLSEGEGLLGVMCTERRSRSEPLGKKRLALCRDDSERYQISRERKLRRIRRSKSWSGKQLIPVDFLWQAQEQ
jgi:hypothetical protein